MANFIQIWTCPHCYGFLTTKPKILDVARNRLRRHEQEADHPITTLEPLSTRIRTTDSSDRLIHFESVFSAEARKRHEEKVRRKQQRLPGSAQLKAGAPEDKPVGRTAESALNHTQAASDLPLLRPNIPLIQQLAPNVTVPQGKTALAPVTVLDTRCPGCGNKWLANRQNGHRKKCSWLKLHRSEPEVNVSCISCIGCEHGFLTGTPFDQHAKSCKKLLHRYELHRAAVTRKAQSIAAQKERQRLLLERLMREKERLAIPNPILAPNKSLHSFGFQLLPPGVSGLQYVRNYYARLERKHGRGWLESRTDESRFEFLENPGPSQWHGGTEGWDGYVVCEFAWTSKVVLECAKVGNAAYVLSDDWQVLIRRTKSDLRLERSHQCAWVPHLGDWQEKLKQILGYQWRSTKDQGRMRAANTATQSVTTTR